MKSRVLFVIIGAFILGVFMAISVINMSGVNNYQLSTNVVKRINYDDGKINIKTREDIASVCVKSTKTEPAVDSLCWIDTIDNETTISIYEYKTYYIWVKDGNGLVSYYNKYNTQND